MASTSAALVASAVTPSLRFCACSSRHALQSTTRRAVPTPSPIRPRRIAYSQRTLTTSAIASGIFDNIGNTLRRIAVGGRQEREAQQKRKGLLPDEAKRLEDDSKRASAYASAASDGSALLDEPETLDVFTASEAEEAHRKAQQLRRQARKRWNARDPVTGAALEHKYSTAQFKISPRKLNKLANQISSKPIDHAILQMEFSHKRAARRIKSTLALARDHAIAKGMDPARLVVSEAWVGKGPFLTRPDFKGRARMGVKHHPTARMSVVLRNGETHEEKERIRFLKAERLLRSMGTGGVARTERPIINVHQRPGWAW